MKKVAFLMVTLALVIASAKKFEVTLYNPAVLAGTELKAGDYALDWNGANVVLKRGKVSVTSPVVVEKANNTHRTTAVLLSERDGKMHVREIRLQGTDVKLMVTEASATPVGAQ